MLTRLWLVANSFYGGFKNNVSEDDTIRSFIGLLISTGYLEALFTEPFVSDQIALDSALLCPAYVTQMKRYRANVELEIPEYEVQQYYSTVVKANTTLDTVV